MVGELVSNFKINDNDSIVITSSNLPSYLKYSVTYSDGEEILLNHELKSGDSETYKVRLEFKKDITEEDLPQDEITIMFGFSPILTQADSRKISRHNNDAFTTEADVRSIQNAIQQYDIDHDACMNFAINDDDIGENQAEDYCSGKNISVCSKLCYNRSIENDFILLKEQGIVDNERYVKIKSYDINYNKCIDALNSNDMYDESVRDSYCKGEDITTYFYPCSRCAGVETITNIDLDIQNGAGTQMSNSGAIENIVYEEVQPDIYITDYDESYGTDVVIPSKINGSKVIGISDNAFNGKGITSVKIPDTVEYVGYGAFANNPLEKVEIVDTDYTYISDCAFGKLRNISEHNIPSTYQCTSSETCFTAELNAENENEAFITGYDENCGSDVSIPSNMWLPKCEDNSCTYGSRTIVGIKEEAFKSKNIEYVDIPNTVTTIETNAFEDNILKDVYLNTTDANIGDCAFGLEDKIEHHNIPNTYKCETPQYCFKEGRMWQDVIYMLDSRIVDGYNVDYCGTDVVIPDEVMQINRNAFSNMGITSLVIPESVEYIESNAFDNNPLKKLSFTNQNARIENCAFRDMSSIKIIDIPNNYKCIRPAEHDLASSYVESKTGTGGLITDDFGNTRYQGTSHFHELNNRVYLNCSDYDNPTDSSCERWSIVGVFDVKRSEDSNFQKRVKLVRDNYLGDYDGYSWDSSDSSVNSGQGVNEWSQADLMHELNENYLDTDLEGIIKWYNDSNNQKEVDFDSKYVMNRETQNLIDDAIWHTGGYKRKEESSYLWEEREPNELYKLDRGSDLVENPKDGITRHSTWRGKVGLLYPSDFSYATTNLNVMIPSERYTEYPGRYQRNSDYNWMASKQEMWMLNPGLKETDAACVRSTIGWSYFLDPDKCPVSDRLKVYPSVYLKADVKVTGEGTYSNPYVFSLD